MTIEQKISAVEDVLNEYGQCNITNDEYKYLKSQISSDVKSEIYSDLMQEIAELSVAGLTENNLKTFAYRVKEITEQLKEKQCE